METLIQPQSESGHARAAIVLAVGFAMATLATPALDQYDENTLRSEQERARARTHSLGWLEIAAADLNRNLRMPMVKMLGPVQRPLRIAQSWALYGNGPNRVKRFELWADGALVYRSNDPEKRWLSSVLRYRKIRPMVGSLCSNRSHNEDALLSYIGRQAEHELGAKKITAVCTVSPWPGDAPREGLRIELHAPDWEITP